MYQKIVKTILDCTLCYESKRNLTQLNVLWIGLTSGLSCSRSVGLKTITKLRKIILEQ